MPMLATAATFVLRARLATATAAPTTPAPVSSAIARTLSRLGGSFPRVSFNVASMLANVARVSQPASGAIASHAVVERW